MNLIDLKTQIENYKPYGMQEEKDKQVMLKYIDTFNNLYIIIFINRKMDKGKYLCKIESKIKREALNTLSHLSLLYKNKKYARINTEKQKTRSQKMYKIDKIQKENQRIHIIGRIISVIIYMILVPIIIFNFTLIIKSFINPNKIPDFFGYKTFVIVSGSMEPTIMTGDAILVKEVPQNEIKTNDIISFSQGGNIVTHRVIEIVEENGTKKYGTKGDNNNAEDKEKITYEQIEGKYQFKINQFGVITEILKSKITLLILISIIVLIYFNKEKREKKRQERKEKRKKYKGME